MKPRTLSLPYPGDSALLFEAIRELPWPVYLDSGGAGCGGRFDIITAAPYQTWTTRSGVTQISKQGHTTESDDDPLKLLRDAMPVPAEPVNGTDLPFSGGLVGYWGYELANQVNPLLPLDQRSRDLPDMMFGLYDWALVVDHKRHCSTLMTAGRDEATDVLWERLVEMLLSEQPQSPSPGIALEFDIELNLNDYQRPFERIQRYIKEGDCYQINFAHGFSADYAGDSWGVYKHLRQVNPAPYSAYLELGDERVLSCSPERFIQLQGTDVLTCPIKGTAPRYIEPQEDEASRLRLLSSDKDRAENLMIVDLMRNDLGKVCDPGSVRVDNLFQTESFARVHHLVSYIRGSLRSGLDAFDLIRACFPGGSVTGAPKRRAMQIIQELESHPRGVYCGSIGYIGYDGRMDTNIAIRTLTHSDGYLRFWAGGGIVADSRLQNEYEETLHKARGILDALSNA